MNTETVQAVVVPQFGFCIERIVTGNGRERTEDDGPERLDHPGRRGDDHQARQDAGNEPQGSSFSKDQAFDDQPGKGATGRGDLGHGQGPGRIQAALDGGAGVEAEPADPQQAGAHHGHDQVVRIHCRHGITFAFAQQDSHHQGADTGRDMNHQTAGQGL